MSPTSYLAALPRVVCILIKIIAREERNRQAQNEVFRRPRPAYLSRPRLRRVCL